MEPKNETTLNKKSINNKNEKELREVILNRIQELQKEEERLKYNSDKVIKTEAKKTNHLLMAIIVICSASIIFSNHLFLKKTRLEIDNQMMENEYNKIWWKENYLILQELQRREIIWYLETLKQENPELIEELKQIALEEENKKLENEIKNNTLSVEIIDELKNNTFVKWNSWALISIIEFSDMECPYCINYHKENISGQMLEKYENNVNYIFKNFPLPAHKNANKESEAAICVKNLEWWEKYLEFINEIFNNTKGWWEGFDLNNLAVTAEKIWVNKTDFEECYNNWTYSKNVVNEFEQWIKIWISSVPSNIVINNKTWEYILLSEVPKLEDFEKIIEEFLK